MAVSCRAFAFIFQHIVEKYLCKIPPNSLSLWFLPSSQAINRYNLSFAFRQSGALLANKLK